MTCPPTRRRCFAHCGGPAAAAGEFPNGFVRGRYAFRTTGLELEVRQEGINRLGNIGPRDHDVL